jgi:hypothetical protein
MENYYADERVLLALEKSSELMDILTFVKEVEFEIKDNLGFDVLWDSMIGKQHRPMGGAMLKWLRQQEKFLVLIGSSVREVPEHLKFIFVQF